MSPRAYRELRRRQAAAQTIRENTPGYSRMTDQELYDRRLPARPGTKFSVLRKREGAHTA